MAYQGLKKSVLLPYKRKKGHLLKDALLFLNSLFAIDWAIQDSKNLFKHQ